MSLSGSNFIPEAIAPYFIVSKSHKIGDFLIECKPEGIVLYIFILKYAINPSIYPSIAIVNSINNWSNRLIGQSPATQSRKYTPFAETLYY